MKINKMKEGDTLVFVLNGRLDPNSSPKLEEELLPAFEGAKEIEIDFTDVEYVSSAGLRLLLMGQKEAEDKGVPMKLHGVSEDVMEVFEMTGFSDMLTIL